MGIQACVAVIGSLLGTPPPSRLNWEAALLNVVNSGCLPILDRIVKALERVVCIKYAINRIPGPQLEAAFYSWMLRLYCLLHILYSLQL